MANASPPPSVSAPALSLAAVSGDIEAGSEWVFSVDEPLLIGRGSKGIQLPDMLVSLQHARISFDKKRGWIIEDLGSATGTWVDEECIKGTSRAITLGTRLRFGDTSFVVMNAKRAPRALRYALTGLLVVAVGVLIFRLIPWGSTSAATIQFSDDVLVNEHEVNAKELDLRWFRERGIPWWTAKHTETTNYDHDASDEVWLTLGKDKGVAVFTFDQKASWVSLGVVPSGCRKVELGMNEFPALECSGESWIFTDGQYRIQSQTGVVVWYQKKIEKAPVAAPEPETPKSKKAKDKAKADAEAAPALPPGKLPMLPGREDVADLFPELGVARMAVRNESQFAAFLADRGIFVPVHYLVCEGAFDGIKAQALREDGTLQQLGVGCLADLRMVGTELGRPVAVAMTPAGRDALIDDVTTFYAGSPHGLFLPADRVAVVEQVRAPPGPLLGGPQLLGETRNPVESGMPILPDNRYGFSGLRTMENLSYALVAAPKAETIIIASEGVAAVDPPGCADLRLKVHTFGPRSRGPFLEVEDVGCPGGPHTVLTASYEAGKAGPIRIPDTTIDIVADIEGDTWPTGFEVSRLRFSWRETAGWGAEAVEPP